MKKYNLIGIAILTALIVFSVFTDLFAKNITVNVSGTYSTEWCNMVITQEGNLITGYYEHDSGVLEGTLNGKTITGRWKEEPTKEPPLDTGLLEFVFENDLMSFTGYWKYGMDANSDWSGSWQGIKTNEPVIQFGGVYDTDWGELHLIQNGFNISGKYDHDDGKLEGVIKGNTIYGKWFEAPSYNEPDDAGLFEFVFTDDFNAFTENGNMDLQMELWIRVHGMAKKDNRFKFQ